MLFLLGRLASTRQTEVLPSVIFSFQKNTAKYIGREFNHGHGLSSHNSYCFMWSHLSHGVVKVTTQLIS